MSKKICPECGILISKMRRHKFGYRIKDATGKIINVSRCVRQHIRHDDKNKPQKGISGRGKSYSQGY